jgi:hypothetical protein
MFSLEFSRCISDDRLFRYKVQRTAQDGKMFVVVCPSISSSPKNVPNKTALSLSETQFTSSNNFRTIFFFFNRHYNPRWVSACSTIVEHSQQDGFTEGRCQRHVKPPTWRRTRDLERSNFHHKRPPASEATLANPAAEGGNMGKKMAENFAESGDFHVTFGFFYMP